MNYGKVLEELTNKIKFCLKCGVMVSCGCSCTCYGKHWYCEPCYDAYDDPEQQKEQCYDDDYCSMDQTAIIWEWRKEMFWTYERSTNKYKREEKERHVKYIFNRMIEEMQSKYDFRFTHQKKLNILYTQYTQSGEKSHIMVPSWRDITDINSENANDFYEASCICKRCVTGDDHSLSYSKRPSWRY